MTKRKKLKGDEYTRYIYPNHSHRVLVDDTGEPVKLPELSRQQKTNMAKPMRQFLEGYHLDLYSILHPEEQISQEQVVEAEAETKKQQSKTHRRKRERSQRRSADKRAQL